MFCKKCGSLLVPVKEKGFKFIINSVLEKFGKKETQKLMKCTSCGEIQEAEENRLNEKIEQSKVRMDVVENENELAVHNHKCSKCEYDKAQIIEKGVWYSDEDFVVHYKCGKCGHVDKGEGKVT